MLNFSKKASSHFKNAIEKLSKYVIEKILAFVEFFILFYNILNMNVMTEFFDMIKDWKKNYLNKYGKYIKILFNQQI